MLRGESPVFRYLVLGLLRNGASLHGYALMKSYRERTGVQLSTGSFYRELQRLVGDGLVETAANPSDADPRRAPYAITETGAAAFDAWLTGPPGAAIGRYDDELSSKVLFLAGVEHGLVKTLIDSWKEELWLRSKIHERACAALGVQSRRADAESFDPLPFLLARNLKHLSADLEFLDEFLEAYDEWVERRRLIAPTRRGHDRATSRQVLRSRGS